MELGRPGKNILKANSKQTPSKTRESSAVEKSGRDPGILLRCGGEKPKKRYRRKGILRDPVGSKSYPFEC